MGLVQGFRRKVAFVGLAGLLGCAPLQPLTSISGGQREIETSLDGPTVPWTSAAPMDRPEDFHFAVVTDRTGEHRDDVFKEAMPKVNLLQPAFVVSVGDLVEGYTNDAARIQEEWDEFDGFVSELEMPFFYAAGNHDMSNAVMAEAWKERFGPSYYHFKYKGVLFLVLNSELFGMVHAPKESLPGPWTQAEQMTWAEEVLAENDDARWTFVIVHQPLWDKPKIHQDWLRIEEMLGDRGHTVFAGHHHNYTQHVRNGRNYLTLATVGGGSEMRGTPWGEFDHVAFVRVGPDEPVLANVEIGGVHPVDIRSEGRRKEVDALAKSIHVEPVMGGRGAFREGTAVYQLSNPLKEALEVHARFDGRPDFDVSEIEVRRTIAPGAKDRIEIELSAREPKRFEELKPGTSHFALAAKGGPAIELERAIVVERPFRIAKGNAFRMDGDLSEWGRLRFVVDRPAEVEGHGHFRGLEDLAFQFDLRQDEENLYLAVRVTDDSFVGSGKKVAREQDGVTFSIDPRPPEERNANGDFWTLLLKGELRRLVIRTVTVASAVPDPLLELFTGTAPKIGKAGARRTEGGYQIELAVPHEKLDEFAGASWEGARINISVTDFDAGEPNHSTLYWRPNRFGGGAAEGSGSFVR